MNFLAFAPPEIKTVIQKGFSSSVGFLPLRRGGTGPGPEGFRRSAAGEND